MILLSGWKEPEKKRLKAYLNPTRAKLALINSQAVGCNYSELGGGFTSAAECRIGRNEALGGGSCNCWFAPNTGTIRWKFCICLFWRRSKSCRLCCWDTSWRCWGIEAPLGFCCTRPLLLLQNSLCGRTSLSRNAFNFLGLFYSWKQDANLKFHALSNVTICIFQWAYILFMGHVTNAFISSIKKKCLKSFFKKPIVNQLTLKMTFGTFFSIKRIFQ